MLYLKKEFEKGWDEKDISRIMQQNIVATRDIHNMIYSLQNSASITVFFFGKVSVLTNSLSSFVPEIAKYFSSYKKYSESNETFITMMLANIDICVNNWLQATKSPVDDDLLSFQRIQKKL